MTDTLVLVPGLNCTARLFEPQIAALGAGREILIADHARDDTIAAIARRLLDRAPEGSRSPACRWAAMSRSR